MKRLALAAVVLGALAAPEPAQAIRNGRAYDVGMTNTIGIAALENFASRSGVLWHFEPEIFLRYVVLAPYIEVARERNGHNFGAFGMNVKYSFLGPALFEPYVQAGVGLPFVGGDIGFGPTLGFGLYVNPLDQFGIVINVYYTLIFGGEDGELGDGSLTATGGLSFRW